ncbi:hypothetical protein HAX54_021246, partial [Datura stramonium]|nr:hypothetical protein [Datura stramonium]
ALEWTIGSASRGLSSTYTRSASCRLLCIAFTTRHIARCGGGVAECQPPFSYDMMPSSRLGSTRTAHPVRSSSLKSSSKTSLTLDRALECSLK